MEPLTIAAAYATIVSLIGQFRSERGSTQKPEFEDFLTWLIETKNNEIKNIVENNAETAIGIKTLLNEKYDALMEKIEVIDGALATFGSKMPGFSNLSIGIKPHSVISDQAFYILKQFEISGASKVLKDRDYGGTILIFIDGSRGDMQLKEPQFLEDDLNTLVGLGLLQLDFNPKGKKLYIYTRKASAIVQAINN